MKLTAQIKLVPDAEQHALLLTTLECANAACNAISRCAFRTGTTRRYDLHHAVYADIRAQFNLAAQVVVRCIAKVADAYKHKGNKRHRFRWRAALAYDSRILTFFPERSDVSIWLLGGRRRIPYVVGEHHAALLTHQKGETDLVYRDGAFYLLATCEVDEADEAAVQDVVGIDFGIVSLATDSDGITYSGEGVERCRQHYAQLRAGLQRARTQSAYRKLVRTRRREARFRHNTNHVISKALVARAKARNAAIALEDLSGITTRTPVSASQRARHHSWAFAQLRAFIEYKARRAGVPVIVVNAAYTSQTCSRCGHCERANRKSRAEFVCRGCGHRADADVNAALNIRARAAVNLPMVAGGDAYGVAV